MQKRDKTDFFLLVQVERPQYWVLIRIWLSARIVKCDDVLKCTQASIMHIRAGDGDVAQRRGAKTAIIFVRKSNGGTACVAEAIASKPNSDVAKSEIGK